MAGDRRFEPRHAANEPVEISWIDSTGAEKKCAGTLRDRSVSGARIRVERPIQVQTPIRIRVRDKELTARVRSCVRSLAGLVIGVEFDAEHQHALDAKL